MIGVTQPPYTCTRCGHVEMSLTEISIHEVGCRPVPARQHRQGVPETRKGREAPVPARRSLPLSWFEFRVRLYMKLFMLDHMRRRRGKG